MGIVNHQFSEYEESLKKLFPIGKYWEELLMDSSSDIAMIAKVRAIGLTQFRARMIKLLAESFPFSCEETIADWERTMLGTTHEEWEIDDRRAELLSRHCWKNIPIVYQLAGGNARVEAAYEMAACGRAKCGRTRIGTYDSMNIVKIVVTGIEQEQRATLEQTVKKISVLANQSVIFVYN